MYVCWPVIRYIILLFVFNTVCYGCLIFMGIKFLWILLVIYPRQFMKFYTHDA